MRVRVFSVFLVLLLGLGTAAHADTLVLPGPNLNNGIRGWSNLGLRMTALKDVVLEQFVFNNQGLADTVRLVDAAGNVAGEYQYAGGEPVHLVHVSWPLVAGTTYKLISVNSNNGKWASYSYPAADDHILVDAAVGNGGQYTSWWFNFTSLQTETVVTTVTVAVDIKPQDNANVINLKSHGKIPVAIYSDTLFDATTIDPASIQMAGAGVVVKKNKRLMARQVDVNEDGLVDLLVMFNTRDFVPELLKDGVATLTGSTVDGTPVEGTDQVRIVPKVRR